MKSFFVLLPLMAALDTSHAPVVPKQVVNSYVHGTWHPVRRRSAGLVERHYSYYHRSGLECPFQQASQGQLRLPPQQRKLSGLLIFSGC